MYLLVFISLFAWITWIYIHISCEFYVNKPITNIYCEKQWYVFVVDLIFQLYI